MSFSLRFKIFCTVFIFLAGAGVTYAQPGETKGRIVTASGKQLAGYISFYSFDETPQEFAFRPQKNGPSETIHDAIAVHFDNGLLFRKFGVKITILSAPYMSRSKEMYADSLFQLSGNLFLQEIYSGEISLYQVRDRYSFPHFFYKGPNDSSLQRLVYQPWLAGGTMRKDDEGKFNDDNTFRNQLYELVHQAGCGDLLQDATKTIVYETTPLISLFHKLDACMGGRGMDRYREQNKWQYKPGIVGGVMYQRSPGRKDMEEKFHFKASPVIGLSILLQKMQSPAFAWGVDLLYNQYSDSSETASNSFGAYKVFHTARSISLRPFYRFYLNEQKVHFIFDAGLSIPLIRRGERVYHYSSLRSATANALQREPASIGSYNFLAFGAASASFDLSLQYSFSFWSKYIGLQLTGRYFPFKR